MIKPFNKEPKDPPFAPIKKIGPNKETAPTTTIEPKQATPRPQTLKGKQPLKFRILNAEDDEELRNRYTSTYLSLPQAQRNEVLGWNINAMKAWLKFESFGDEVVQFNDTQMTGREAAALIKERISKQILEQRLRQRAAKRQNELNNTPFSPMFRNTTGI